MRKVLLTICLVVAMLLVAPAKSKAKESSDKSYFSVGISKDHTTIELGGVRKNKLFGFGTSFYGGANETLQIGEERNKDAFVGKFGLEVTKDSGLFLNGILGISRTEKCFWDYKLLYNKDCPIGDGHYWQAYEKTTDEYSILYGIGISYFPKQVPICVSVDYDNCRKLTGSIGLVWRF